MKLAIKIVLLAAIAALGYFIVQGIAEPMQFEQNQKKRYKATIQKLMDIREAQKQYLNKYDHFTADFDSLIDFVKNDSIKMVKAIGARPDSIATDKKALELVKKGLLKMDFRRDTSLISVLDSLFGKGYEIDLLAVVPFTDGERFVMDAKILEVGSKVNDNTLKVPVFEAKVLNRVLLKGLNEQLRINLDDEQLKMDRYPGLKVGSLETNVNNAGNWEK